MFGTEFGIKLMNTKRRRDTKAKSGTYHRGKGKIKKQLHASSNKTNLLVVAIVSAAVQSFRPLHPLVCENTTEELGLPPGFLCRREGEETSDTVETPTWLAQKIPIHKDMKTSLILLREYSFYIKTKLYRYSI